MTGSINFKIRPWKGEFFGKFDLPQTSEQITRRVQRNGSHFFGNYCAIFGGAFGVAMIIRYTGALIPLSIFGIGGHMVCRKQLLGHKITGGVGKVIQKITGGGAK